MLTTSFLVIIQCKQSLKSYALVIPFFSWSSKAVRVDPKLKVLLMGSYRRGEESCGNIEVIVTRNNSDGQTYHDSMSRLYKRLRKDGLITYELSQSGFDKQGRIGKISSHAGSTLIHVIMIPQDSASLTIYPVISRLIDLLGVPFNQLGAALIYFTGEAIDSLMTRNNEIFNRSLRLKARQMGYTLNQKGLFGSAPTDDFQSRFNQLITPSAIPSKLAHSSSSSSSSSKTCLVASKTEEEIFEILNVPFLLPHERNL
ncbi:hypothetical protein KEM48_001858 [Puccinia striiformis f. sp. tritici PST-130]|nr:hypothetical protein KEM48_001858 [Puccinia striiformis f. sp. tritici PST-130]